MSKRTVSKLHYIPSATLPPLPHYKTQWDLENLYYTSVTDPRIETDIVYAIQKYRRFAKRWRHQPFTTDPITLASALVEYEQLVGDPRISRPGRYFSLRSELDVTDSTAEKALAQLRKRLRPASDSILFFTLELGKVSKESQRLFLSHTALVPFRYFLTQLFTGAIHTLTEAEEKIVRLKAPQAAYLWSQMVEKLISTSDITWKNRTIPLPEALETIETVSSSEKPKLWQKIITKIDSFGIPAEHEFNAIITDVRTEDEIRKYKKPYSATALAYEHDEKGIESLVTAVTEKGFLLSQKFYTLKAKLAGVEKIHYAQKYDTIGTEPTINFDEALTVCRDVFYQTNWQYGELFDSMLSRGQIDVYPKKGKRGGAFMSDQTGHPIQVLLNHTDTFKALETLAHEMGHAVHAARSATNRPLYDGHSIVTAETASTLFENLVHDAIMDVSDETTKQVLLHNKITRDIATIQRQIAFFNCELEIHETIHREGAMTHEELKTVMYRHLTSYLGKSVAIAPIDGASYVYIPHLRYGFYVYSYTFGHLMSSVIARRYRADRSYSRAIDTFLSAGSSDSVNNIFKSIGLKTHTPEIFLEALEQHAADIKRFEKMVNRAR